MAQGVSVRYNGCIVPKLLFFMEGAKNYGREKKG
jgi:hypothetical protein